MKLKLSSSFHILGVDIAHFAKYPNPPKNAICLGKERIDIDLDDSLMLWSVVAHTPYGNIPGKHDIHMRI